MPTITQFHQLIQNKKIFILFTWFTRILLAIGFTPSGLKKLLGQRFTSLGLDSPVGFFFEALYQTGWYWNFLGAAQLFAALLLLIPRTAYAGALLYLPIIVNIFIIVVAMNFKGTPYIAGLMLLATIYLLFWDWPKTKKMWQLIFSKSN